MKQKPGSCLPTASIKCLSHCHGSNLEDLRCIANRCCFNSYIVIRNVSLSTDFAAALRSCMRRRSKRGSAPFDVLST